MNDVFYGINIKTKKKIFSVLALIGEDTLILLPSPTTIAEDTKNFCKLLRYYTKQTEKIKIIFALIEGGHNRDMIRQKIQNNFIQTITEEKLTLLWAGSHKEAYYSSKLNTENIVGIEIRFNKNTWDWTTADNDIGKITGILKGNGQTAKKEIEHEAK